MALRLRGATSGYTELKAPASAGDNTLTLPVNNGSANQILKTDGNGNLSWVDDNSGVSLSGSTNNTIATVTGANALQGEANLTFDGTTLKAETGNPVFELSGTTANGGNTFIHINANANHWVLGGDNYTSQNLFVIKDGTPASSNHRFCINSTGNVGIGTTSPSTKLHVADSTGNADAVLKIEAEAGADAYLALDTSNGGGATADVRFQMDGTTKGSIEYVNNGANINNMIFRNNTNTERMKIKADGDIEVGGNLKTNNLPGRNLIINGAMQVAQRGTDTAKLYDYCGPDRFYFGGDGSQRSTISQANLTLDTKGHSKAWRMEVTTASGSPSAGHYQMLSYRFEGQDLQQLKKGTADTQPLTLQFWVRSPKTGIHIVELVDQTNSSRHINKSYTVSSANTWQKVEITFAGDTTGSITSDNARRLDLNFWLMAGSTYTSGTLQTSWGSDTNANRAVGQVNCVDSTSNNFYLTGVQLEIGSTATNFEYRSYGDELAKCQRYFIKDTRTRGNGGVSVVTSSLDSVAGVDVDFPTTMRASPSINFLGTTYRNGGNSDAQVITDTGFTWGRKRTGAGGGAGTYESIAAYIIGGYTASAEL